MADGDPCFTISYSITSLANTMATPHNAVSLLTCMHEPHVTHAPLVFFNKQMHVGKNQIQHTYTAFHTQHTITKLFGIHLKLAGTQIGNKPTKKKGTLSQRHHNSTMGFHPKWTGASKMRGCYIVIISF